MLNVSAPKVVVPTLLFAFLRPGALLQYPFLSKCAPVALKNHQKLVFFNAALFALMYAVVARVMGLVLTQTDLIVTTALYVLLSPGILLTLPPGVSKNSQGAILVHAIVFAIVFAFLRRQFPQYY